MKKNKINNEIILVSIVAIVAIVVMLSFTIRKNSSLDYQSINSPSTIKNTGGEAYKITKGLSYEDEVIKAKLTEPHRFTPVFEADKAEFFPQPSKKQWVSDLKLPLRYYPDYKTVYPTKYGEKQFYKLISLLESHSEGKVIIETLKQEGPYSTIKFSTNLVTKTGKVVEFVGYGLKIMPIEPKYINPNQISSEYFEELINAPWGGFHCDCDGFGWCAGHGLNCPGSSMCDYGCHLSGGFNLWTFDAFDWKQIEFGS